jgi:nucleotide-binding universal stress UspA family protein
MTHSTPQQSTSSKFGILVGVDGSPESDDAIRWATQEAIFRDLPLTVMHVVPRTTVGWPARYLQTSFDESQDRRAHEVIEQAQKSVQVAAGVQPPPTVHTRIEYGDVASTMISASRDAFLTVVGSQGLNAVERVVFGSISGGMVHYGHGPIAVIHRGDDDRTDSHAPVLVGIDGSPASEEATAVAFDEASRRGVDLIALHAWSDVGVFPILGMDWHEYEDLGHEVLGERLAGWQERYPDVHVHRRVVCDKPAHWLIVDSEHAQLVVVGSHGRGGFAGLQLGSVAAKTVQGAMAPTIVVRPR